MNQDIEVLAREFSFKEELKGQSVVVTGATGLIGSLIVRLLVKLKQDYGVNVEIVGVTRSYKKVEELFGDIPVDWKYDVNLEEGKLPEIKQSDYIIHCASPTSSAYFINRPVETFEALFYGANAMLQLAKKNQAKSMVNLSSVEYYGVVDSEEPLTEDSLGYINPYNPRSSYSLGKRVSESLCHAYYKEYGVPVKVARLTQVFGAGIASSDNRVFAQFARSVVAGEDIVLHTEGTSSKPYCYSTDAIDAIFHILFKGKSGDAYNVANPTTYVSIREFAQLMQRNFNPGGRVVVHLDNTRGYAPDTLLKLDTSKLEKLGWRPRYNLEKMSERLVEYIRENEKE